MKRKKAKTMKKKKHIRPSSRHGLFSGPREPKKIVSKPPAKTMVEALKKAGVRLALPRNVSRTALSPVQSKKRFILLSMERDRPLIEALAKNYAAIFNAGFSVKSVGIETYYTGAGGKESFYFGDLRQMKVLPEKGFAAHGEDSIAKRIGEFYSTILMNDMNARKAFVQVFKQGLKNELRPLFDKAIRHSHLAP